MITLQRLAAAKGSSAADAAYKYLAEVSSQASAEEQAHRPGKVDEYYLADRSQQRWITMGIAPDYALVADGARVTADDFLALAGGRRPGNEGEALVPQSDKRSPGTDLTFAPSKGVSILWAGASDAERREIETALHESSRAALDYALRQGWFTTRRGSGRQGTQVLEAVAGIQAASFLHTTSREGDPSLHQHTLIFNVARTDDGQWRSIDFAELFRNQKVLSARFDAELAFRLRERFGLAWQPRGSNNIDVAGVSDALRDQFSKRNQQIDVALDHAHGTQSARDIAWAQTRGKKIDLPPPSELERRWSAELARHVPADNILQHSVDSALLAHAVAARRIKDQALRSSRPDIAEARAEEIRAAISPQPRTMDQTELTASASSDNIERLREAAQPVDHVMNDSVNQAALNISAARSRALMNKADRNRLAAATSQAELPLVSATPTANNEIDPTKLTASIGAKRLALAQDTAAQDQLRRAAVSELEPPPAPEPELNQRQAGAGERLAEYFAAQGYAAEHDRWNARMRPTTAEDLIVRDQARAQKQIAKQAYDLVGGAPETYDLVQQIYAESLFHGLRHDSVVDHRALLQQAFLLGAQRGVAPADIEDGLETFLSRPEIIQGHARGDFKSLRDGSLCVSTFAILEQEDRIRSTVSAGVGVVEDLSVYLAVQPGIDKLSKEQRAAAGQILGTDRVSVLQAPAGAGKTTTSKAVLGAAEDAGYTTVLVAPSHKAAKVLAEDSGRPADSIQSLLASPTKLKEINSKSLILVDEAGMVSLDDMSKLAKLVDATGCRVILQGDSNQLESPAGGSPLHLITEIVPPARIETIRRQSADWQKAATTEMSKLRSDKGMQAYLDRGHVDFVDGAEATIAAGIDKYLEYRDTGGSALALAYTRSEVAALNTGIREKLATRGELGEIIGVEQARQKFSGGEDKIVELEIRAGDRLRVGERTDEAGTKTGDIITILGRYDENRYLVSLDKDAGKRNRIVSWNDLAKDNWAADLSEDAVEAKRKPPARKKAAKIAAPRAEYYYASTIHGSQGDTVDRAVLVDSAGIISGREAYVGGSRHRHELAVVVDEKHLAAEIVERQVAAGTEREDVNRPSKDEIASAWLEKLKRFGRNINVQDLDLVDAQGAAIGNPLRGETQPRDDHHVIARDLEIAGKRARHAGNSKPKELTNDDRDQNGHESRPRDGRTLPRADGRAAGNGRGDDRGATPAPETGAGDGASPSTDRRAETGDRGPNRPNRRANGIPAGSPQAGHDAAGGRPADRSDTADSSGNSAGQRAAGAPQSDAVTHPAATRVPGERTAAADKAAPAPNAVAKPSARDRSRARQRDRGRTPGGMSM
jgi:conjugative relaxase-like TrwC/TraI family protein